MKVPPIPSHGTIFHAYGDNKNSSVIFSDEFILTTGLVFLQHADDSLLATLSSALERNSILAVHGDERCDADLSQLDFRLTRKRGDPEGTLEEVKVHIGYVIRSVAVQECFETTLKGLQFATGGGNRPVEDYSTLFASFVIMSRTGVAVPSLARLRRVVHTLQAKTYDRQAVAVLEPIVTVSTPFGIDNFLDTANFGHISNVFGRNGCLLLLDTPLAFGCQGGAVYSRELAFRGLIIGATFTHRNENVSFPLAINANELYAALLPERNICRSRTVVPFDAMRSVCMIDTAGCWGTGCAFGINGRRFIITCAHVVSTDNIRCYFEGKHVVQPKLIYKNPTFDSAYDLALMEMSYDDAQQRGWLAKLANYIPQIGQRIYAVGFPVFKPLTAEVQPSVCPGRVTQYSEGLLFTDCSVQSGQSGGPVFDKEGNLIAIAVSNFRSSLDDRIYPFHNMCIPIGEVYGMIERYAATGDAGILRRLEANAFIRDKWKLNPSRIRNKL